MHNRDKKSYKKSYRQTGEQKNTKNRQLKQTCDIMNRQTFSMGLGFYKEF